MRKNRTAKRKNNPAGTGNSATARFHRKLYTRRAISESIGVYETVCTFSVKTEGDYYLVTIDRVLDPEYESSLLDEFKNNVLCMTIAGKKKGGNCIIDSGVN